MPSLARSRIYSSGRPRPSPPGAGRSDHGEVGRQHAVDVEVVDGRQQLPPRQSPAAPKITSTQGWGRSVFVGSTAFGSMCSVASGSWAWWILWDVGCRTLSPLAPPGKGGVRGVRTCNRRGSKSPKRGGSWSFAPHPHPLPGGRGTRTSSAVAHPPVARSTCPPNLLRMAERTFSAKVCSCRERNRCRARR